MRSFVILIHNQPQDTSLGHLKVQLLSNILNQIFSFWSKDTFWLISHQQDLPRHKGDQTNHRGYGLESGHYFCVGDVVDGVEDDQVAGVGDGHQAEGDERGQPNHLDGKIHHNHNCQGQLTKYQPELQGDLEF